jgi:hypothetical protein|tara:strand:+ start:190 stop:348 length:159 start_codon:yes stop_codon:yes gene_type:complete
MNIFKNNDKQLVNRAKASIESIKKGRTINIADFKTEVENWKRNYLKKLRHPL